jgi:hypothetical protein
MRAPDAAEQTTAFGKFSNGRGKSEKSAKPPIPFSYAAPLCHVGRRSAFMADALILTVDPCKPATRATSVRKVCAAPKCGFCAVRKFTVNSVNRLVPHHGIEFAEYYGNLRS